MIKLNARGISFLIFGALTTSIAGGSLFVTAIQYFSPTVEQMKDFQTVTPGQFVELSLILFILFALGIFAMVMAVREIDSIEVTRIRMEIEDQEIAAKAEELFRKAYKHVVDNSKTSQS